MKSTLAVIFLIFTISTAANSVWGVEPILSQQIIENRTSISKLQIQIERIKEMVSSSHESINKQHRDTEEIFGQLKQMQGRTNTELNDLQLRINLSESHTNDNFNKIIQLGNDLGEISLNNNRNNKGSRLILLSLLFEIPAVIFLSSTSFVETQKDVFTLGKSPNMIGSWGSGLEPLDTNIRYLSFIALSSLFVGFGLQFVGIVYILTLSFKWILVCICVLLIISSGVIYYLIGNGEQQRSEKLKILIRNTKRLLFKFMRIEVNRCDYCLKKIGSDDTEVWWLEHASSEPYNGVIRVGHKKCLEKSNWFDPSRSPRIHTSSLHDFLKIHVNKIKNKMNDKGDYYSFPEWSLDRVVNKSKVVINDM